MNLYLKHDDLNYLSLLIYTFGIVFAENTVVFYGCAFLFLGIQLLALWTRGTLRLNAFLVIYGVYILYLLACCGNAVFPAISLKRCIVMTLNLVINGFVMYLLADPVLRRRYLNGYCVTAALFGAYLVLSSGSNLFAGRLGEFTGSFLAKDGIYNANIVGCTLLYAMIFDFYFFLEDRKPIRPLRMLFCLGCILLTGSRKAIISAALVLFLVPMADAYVRRKAVMRKLIRYSAIAIVVVAIALVLLFKVPALYEIAGERIEAMFLSLTEMENSTDSSLRFRNRFVNQAKEYFFAHPIFGIGIDNFAQVNFIKGFYAHNNYWELLCGSGIIGGTLYYLLYVYVFVKLLRHRSAQDSAPFLVFMVLLAVNDFYMVTYLQRLCMLFLFSCNSLWLPYRQREPLPASQGGPVHV